MCKCHLRNMRLKFPKHYLRATLSLPKLYLTLTVAQLSLVMSEHVTNPQTIVSIRISLALREWGDFCMVSTKLILDVRQIGAHHNETVYNTISDFPPCNPPEKYSISLRNAHFSFQTQKRKAICRTLS